MNYLKTLTIAVLLASLSSTISFSQEVNEVNQPSNTGNMTVQINNIKSDKGVIMLALFNSEKDYNEANLYKAAQLKIHEDTADYVFENIPYGEYAIKYYQDENGNGKLDTNMFGMPTESFGFSNNATGNFGPASYNDAKFIFSEDKQLIEMNIN